ncbi:hypothetical protein WA026_008398 [Henosepilachna vigintioctopunctata]|uniref:Uncharacterized protein n=1 Tax=Henosepilachna vigintioctopunctata TaxID=420089 RepID=A0AAW1UBJ2_9CUCU
MRSKYQVYEKNCFDKQRESAHRDADRERRLRMDSETRAKQAIQEATRCRSRLKLLTTEFARFHLRWRSRITPRYLIEETSKIALPGSISRGPILGKLETYEVKGPAVPLILSLPMTILQKRWLYHQRN